MENPTIDPSEGNFKGASDQDPSLTEGADNQKQTDSKEDVSKNETAKKDVGENAAQSEEPTKEPLAESASEKEENISNESTEVEEVVEEQSKESISEEKGEDEAKTKPKEDKKSGQDFDKDKLAKLGPEELLETFRMISEQSDWMFRNNEIMFTKDLFEEKYQEEMNRVKATFLEEGGNEIDFTFKPKYKEQFDHLSYEYRQRKRKHYKDLEATQKANLEKRQNIIEEIKQLISVDENINTIYKRFRALQESWHNSGSVPRAENQNLWQTYKHHVERFYDFLHLNRDLRDLDFKHNYEEKLKIIEQAEALIDLQDVMKANRDLNTLHRLWKNDLGPVAPQHREDLWKRFQAATKIIHQKRNEYQKNIDVIFSENLEKKKAILAEMESFVNKMPNNHKDWQLALNRFNELREAFKNIGNVPSNESKASWKSFRELGRTFTHEKNVFYKKQKSEHKVNIDQKKALINELDQILESDNWKSQTNTVKGLQSKWKKIGFIPRKIDNQLWNEFRGKNNLYFERVKSGYQKMSGEEEKVYNEKLKFIESFKAVKLPSELDAFVDLIKKTAEELQSIGVMNAGLNDKMNSAFLKAVVEGVKKSAIAKKEHENYIFESKLILKNGDPESIRDEIQQLRTKISAIKGEINQLENNLEFFSNSSSDNPLFKEVQTKINRLIKNMELLDGRMIRLKQLNNAIKKQAQLSSEADEVSEEE